MTLDAPEVQETTKRSVCCDGNGEHPRVWLHIAANQGWVECGYCDKKFVLKEKTGE